MVEDDNRTLLVTCPAIPELTTFGTDVGEAVKNACYALDEAIAARIADGLDVPPFEDHSGRPGTERFATLAALSSLKAQLYQVCRGLGVTRAELARRLGWAREQVDRLFRLDHNSRLDQLEAAFRAIGRQIDARAVASLDPAQA